MAKLIERLLWGGCLVLPLACWPGLAHPFSTPKIWLLGVLAVLAARKPGAPRAGDWLWLVWVGALAGSALLAPVASSGALLLAVLPLPLYWAVRDGRVAAGKVRSALLWGSVVESAMVVLQYGYLDPLRLLGWQPESFPAARMRMYGTLGNPDFVAAWLAATLPLYVSLMGTSPNRSLWSRLSKACLFSRTVAEPRPEGAVSDPPHEHDLGRVAAWAGLILQLAAIAATGSRVFLPALAAAVVVLAIERVAFRRLLAAGVVAAAALLWLSPARPLGTTLQGRLYLAQVPAAHLGEVPLTGYGPGSFAFEFAGWQADWLARHGANPFAGPVDHAHNDYLEFFVEYGPVGFGALVALCGWLLFEARGDGAAWAGLAALAAIAWVDFPFHRPAEWGLFWILMGTVARGKIY